jgi:hypothetical protein
MATTYTLSRFDVLKKLAREIEKAGSLRKWALTIGASAAYVSDVMLGKRDPGPKILTALKLEKVPQAPQSYRKVM